MLQRACLEVARSLDDVRFRHFSDPQSALQWISGHDVAEIVVEGEMSGMAGSEFARQLHPRTDRPRPHVVVVERPGNPVPASARCAGVDDIVPRPMAFDTFVQLIEISLELRLAERALWREAVVLRGDVGADGADGERAGASERASRRAMLLPLLVLLPLLFIVPELQRSRHRTAAADTEASPVASPTGEVASSPGMPSQAPRTIATIDQTPSPAPPGSGAAGGPGGGVAGPGGAQAAGARAAATGMQGHAGDAAASTGRIAGDATAAGGAAAGIGVPIAPPPGGAGALRGDHDGGASATTFERHGGSAGSRDAAPAAAGSPSGATPAASDGGGGGGGNGAGRRRAGDGLGGPPGTSSGSTTTNGASRGGIAAAALAAAGSPAGGTRMATHGLAAGDSGYLVLDGAGRDVDENDADVPRAPASTIKVLTAAVAIATLGPEARLTTRLVAQGPLHDGVIAGGVALVGGGDPVLSSADLDEAAATLENLGVRRVHGDLLIDATAFTGPEFNPHWAAAERPFAYAAGTSSVSVDEGTRVDVRTGQRRAVPDNVAYAGSVLASRLRAHGIAIDGSIRSGHAHDGTVLWTHESPPLSMLITKMLVESDNHIAEQLLREVGRVAGGVGSEESGIAQLRAYLVRNHVPTAGLQLYDGSGLTLDNRVTPRTMATLLWRIQGTAEGDRIHAALPAIENDSASREPGRILAKTGNVNDVRGLVGYVDRDAGALSFAFLDTIAPGKSPDARRSDEAQWLHHLARVVP